MSLRSAPSPGPESVDLGATSALTDKLIWVLADDRAGNVSQALGVAEALGMAFEVKRLAYTPLAGFPFLIGATLAHLRRPAAHDIRPPWPDLLIAAGRRAAPVARAVKRSSGGRTFLVQTMWPGRPVGEIDLIVAPEHDQVAERPNVIRTVGAPHRVTAARLAAEAEAWHGRLSELARPRIALLVGGSTRRRRFTPGLAAELGRKAAAFARRTDGTLMVTTSRRTETLARDALLAELGDAAKVVFDWQSAGENPYFGYLALADAIIATGDSTSMCAEACATGRPVYIFAPPRWTADKHKRLHQKLYEIGCARPLDTAVEEGAIGDWSYPPLDDAGTVAREIVRRAGL